MEPRCKGKARTAWQSGQGIGLFAALRGGAHSLPCAFVYLFLAHKNLVDVTVQRFAYLVELLPTDPVRHFVGQVVDSRSPDSCLSDEIRLRPLPFAKAGGQ